MARKPYVAKQPSNWYLQHSFYKKYMLRELTCIPVILAALNLFCCIAALAMNLEAWQSWLAVQRHPLMVAFNLFAIIAALFNTVEWFAAMPKAMPIQIGESFVEDKKMIAGSWVAFVTISLIIFAIIVALAWGKL